MVLPSRPPRRTPWQPLVVAAVGVVVFLSLAGLLLGSWVNVWSIQDAQLAEDLLLATPKTGQKPSKSEKKKPVKEKAKEVAGSDEPVKIAHAISLITCQKASTVAGFMDALMILRHSIHQNSVHAGRGRYSYQMFAIIHEDGCNDPAIPVFLERLGYQTLIVPTPVALQEIENDWYRDHVEGENCCGSKEFIKLYAYTLTDYPIVVHWDLDVAVLQPMDDLYDAMLYDKDSHRGSAARARLRIQRPSWRTLPDRIDAFVTRDVTSATPDEKAQAVQGGFVVARPSMEHFEIYKDFIKKGNYTPGRGPGSGWDVSSDTGVGRAALAESSHHRLTGPRLRWIPRGHGLSGCPGLLLRHCLPGPSRRAGCLPLEPSCRRCHLAWSAQGGVHASMSRLSS